MVLRISLPSALTLGVPLRCMTFAVGHGSRVDALHKEWLMRYGQG